MGLVGINAIDPFTTPANGAIDDADIVRGNDNALRAAMNDHDGDATIHFQSSVLAARPVAGKAGRLWLTADERRIWYDTGAAWQEIAYAKLASPTFTGTVTAVNLTVAGSALNSLTVAGAFGSIILDGPSGGLVAVPTADYLMFSVGTYFLGAPIPWIQLQSAHPTQAPPGTLGAILIFAGNTPAGDINVLPGAGKKATIGPTGAAQLEVRSDGKAYYGGSVLFNSSRPTYGAPTGTLARTTFDQSTVTLAELAKRVAALITDLQSTHGLLG